MRKSVLIIKGFSKSDIELRNDRKIIQLYIDFFCSNAGGVFDFDKEIFVYEEPDLSTISSVQSLLNDLDYLIIVLIGHGANKDGTQIFQLQENLLIQPGQLQFNCPKQLHIVESCRNVINVDLDIKRINRLIPKYAYGGIVKHPLTKEESKIKFNNAIQISKDGIVYLFAANVGESAYNYFFLQILIDISIYAHEYFRNNTYKVSEIFEAVKNQVINASKGAQHPVKIGDADFPFVITII